MNPVIQEFRDSLPLILEGKDPLIEYGVYWYLAALRGYEEPGFTDSRVIKSPFFTDEGNVL